MTRKDRINRIIKEQRERFNAFLNPPEPKQPDERADPDQSEQANRAEQPKPCRKLGWTPPELTEARKRKIDAQDRRIRGQISKYLSPTGD